MHKSIATLALWLPFTAIYTADVNENPYVKIIDRIDAFSLFNIQIGDSVDGVVMERPGYLSLILDSVPAVKRYKIKGDDGSMVFADENNKVFMIVQSLGVMQERDFQMVHTVMRAVGGQATAYTGDTRHYTFYDIRRVVKMDLHLTRENECVLIMMSYKDEVPVSAKPNGPQQ